MRRIALTVALAGITGCSFGMRTVPDGWEPTEDPHCSTSIGRPAVDGLLALLATAAHPALAIPNAIAALYGVAQASSCSSAESKYEHYLSDEAEEDLIAAGTATPPRTAAVDPDPERQATEVERAADEARRLEEEQRQTRARRAWETLTPGERRRWQKLPARARRVVQQRAMDRLAAADRVIDGRREVKLRRLRDAAAAVRRAADEKWAAEQRRVVEDRRRVEQEEERVAAEEARQADEARRIAADKQAAEEAARRLEDDKRKLELRLAAEDKLRLAAEKLRLAEDKRRAEEERKRPPPPPPPPPPDEGPPPIRVTRAAPNQGSAKGGDMITLHGSGFDAYRGKSMEIYFGKKPAVIVGFTSDSKLVVESPPGTAGATVTIRLVIENDRQLALVSAFTYK